MLKKPWNNHSVTRITFWASCSLKRIIFKTMRKSNMYFQFLVSFERKWGDREGQGVTTSCFRWQADGGGGGGDDQWGGQGWRRGSQLWGVCEDAHHRVTDFKDPDWNMHSDNLVPTQKFAQSTRVLHLDLVKMLLLKSFNFFFPSSDPNKRTKAARCRPNSSPAEQPYAHF